MTFNRYYTLRELLELSENKFSVYVDQDLSNGNYANIDLNDIKIGYTFEDIKTVSITLDNSYYKMTLDLPLDTIYEFDKEVFLFLTFFC